MASCGGTRHGLRAEGGGLRGGVRSTEESAAADADAAAGASTSADAAAAAAAPKGDDAGACLAEEGGVDVVLPPPFLAVVWSTMVVPSPVFCRCGSLS